jgi:predicted metal-binding membrane protein
MWLAMMVAMMLPSALPMFLNTKRTPVSLSVMATGYFAVWLAAGLAIYVPGVLFAVQAMRWDSLSRAVPVVSSAALVGAGTLQFTRWKLTCLIRCRSPFGCLASQPEREASFGLGCKQGVACCLCCAAPMLILIMFGMMNPLVVIGVAVIIAAEKILPQPEIIARLVGISTITAGIVSFCLVLPRIHN